VLASCRQLYCDGNVCVPCPPERHLHTAETCCSLLLSAVCSRGTCSPTLGLGA
jgi:hypothetical protein